jgi:isopentenyl-diphosphate delta-isomerase
MNSFELRKRSHLELALRDEMQVFQTGRAHLQVLEHDALPELDFNEVSLSVGSSRGSSATKLRTPFYISGMTAGHGGAKELNLLLAECCQLQGWAMGVGSQRREFESGHDLNEWGELKSRFPTLEFIGNLGLSQIATARSMDQVLRTFESLKPKFIAVHLNALQEVLQVEGTPFFKEGIFRLKEFVSVSESPIILKETGCGFSVKALEKIKDLPLYAIDCAGLGGTHWGRIEGARAQQSGNELLSQVSKTFENWGGEYVSIPS